MLPRKDWPADLVLQLLVRLLLSVAVGVSVLGLVAAMARRGGNPLSPAVELLLGGLVFHGTGLLLIHRLVRQTGGTWPAAFGLGRDPRRALLTGVAGAIVVLPPAWGLQSLCTLLLEAAGRAPAAQQAVELLIRDGSLSTRAIIATFAVGLAPIVEEALFRGLLYPLVRDLGRPRTALWGTAVLFGAIHMNAAAFLPLTLFGAALAWLYRRTGNLLAPIAAHATFNLAPFVLLAAGVEFGK